MDYIIILADDGDEPSRPISPENKAKLDELVLLIIRDNPPKGYELMEKICRLWPMLSQLTAYKLTQRAKLLVERLQACKSGGLEAQRKLLHDILTQKPSHN